MIRLEPIKRAQPAWVALVLLLCGALSLSGCSDPGVDAGDGRPPPRTAGHPPRTAGPQQTAVTTARPCPMVRRATAEHLSPTPGRHLMACNSPTARWATAEHQTGRGSPRSRR